MRLSWQASQKNKIGIYYNNKKRTNRTPSTTLRTSRGRPVTSSRSPTSWSSGRRRRPTACCSRPGSGATRKPGASSAPPMTSSTRWPSASPTPTRRPRTGYVQLIQNYHGRVGSTDTASHNPNYRGNFNLSYVTGAHSFKTGIDLNGARRWSDITSVVPYSYVVSTLANNGAGVGIPVPQSITLRSDGCTDPLVRQVNGALVGGMTSIQPYCPTPILQNKVTSEGGVFVQDRWTMDRLTVSGGLRIDWFFSENPTIHLGPSLLTPNRNYDVPEVQDHALQGLDAEGRGGLRPVRQRPHGAQGQRRQVRARAGARRRPGHPGWLQRAAHVVADVGRQRPRLRPRLRPDPQHHPGADAGRRRQPGGHLQRGGGRERELLRPSRCGRPRPCRTTPATAGASGRTAGSWRSRRSTS